MLGDARVADAVGFEQLAIDESVLGMNMENARPEFLNVDDRINELAKEMAGVPFDANVFAFGLIEEALPHGGLREHVVTHDRKMIRPHWAMFESDAHGFVGGHFGDRLPKLKQSGKEIFERFIDRIVS